MQLGCADVQRWITVLAPVVDPAAELAQGVNQIANRALVHARHTAEFIVAAHHGQRCGQRADGGAGVAHEELGLALARLTTQAVDCNRAAILVHAAAQLPQCFEHDACVVGVQQLMQSGGALTERSQQQQAVGDALGAWQDDRAAGRRQRR